MRNKGGRPSKLTEEVKNRLLDALRMGNYYDAACAYAGIHYYTFRLWMAKGEKAKSGEFFEFFEAVKEAENEAEARTVLLWQKAIPKDWRAAQGFLERRYPERWGKRETHVVEGGDEKKPIRVEVNLDELLDQYEAIVREIQKSSVGIVQEDSSVEQVHSSSSDPETD